jgi:hypothetical protein
MESHFLKYRPELSLLQDITFLTSEEAKNLFTYLRDETFDIKNPTVEDLKLLEMLVKIAQIVTNYNFPTHILEACENIKNKLTEEKLFSLSDKLFDDLFIDENKINTIIEKTKKDIINGNVHEMSVLCTQK